MKDKDKKSEKILLFLFSFIEGYPIFLLLLDVKIKSLSIKYTPHSFFYYLLVYKFYSESFYFILF